MTHLNGERDADLHHEDGTHRDEPPPVRERYSGHAVLGDVVRGSDVETREAGWAAWHERRDAHLAQHGQENKGDSGT